MKTKRVVEPRKDPVREERITMEIVVDAYTPEERAIGWYSYLEGAHEVVPIVRRGAGVNGVQRSNTRSSQRATHRRYIVYAAKRSSKATSRT